MIVRIMGQGQWQVPDTELGRLNNLDDMVADAVDSRDPDALAATLSEMIALVRRRGTELTDGEVRLSDFIVPDARAPLREVAEWLSEARAEDGLIPG